MVETVPVESEQLIEALGRSGLDGQVLCCRDAGYDEGRRVWNGLIDRRPAAIVRVESVADVQRVIEVSAEAGSLLAIRCGGHSFPGFSTCDGGIVLDLSSWRRVSIDPVERTAEVPGGALLGDLDRAAVPHGLVAPAGVVSHTGAGGLTLGGGMGWLSRRLGLTIDSLLAAEVCLADGRLLLASEAEEPELFWGLRGGGGNFGVVTRFVFRLHDLGSIHVGSWSCPAADAAGVLAGYAELAERASRQLSSAFTVTRETMRLGAVWSGPEAGANAAVAAFGDLGRRLSGSTGGITFLQLQSRSDEHFAWGRRYYAKGGFLATLTPEVIDCLTTSIASAPTSDSEIYVLQLGGAVTDLADDATAYTGRQAGFYWIVEPVWDTAGDDALCLSWGRETAAALGTLSLSVNYVNEQSDVGDSTTLDAYGPTTYERLAALKTRFDPSNLFCLNQNIRPAAAQ
jgi:FAD/FMN-containing dehydrogenase